MKFLILLALVASCYGKDDARKDIGQNGGPDPINCVVEGGGKYAATVIDCVDGVGDEWKCTRGDGCVNFGHVAHTAPSAPSGGAR